MKILALITMLAVVVGTHQDDADSCDTRIAADPTPVVDFRETNCVVDPLDSTEHREDHVTCKKNRHFVTHRWHSVGGELPDSHHDEKKTTSSINGTMSNMTTSPSTTTTSGADGHHDHDSGGCLPCGIKGVAQVFIPGKSWNCMHRFVDMCYYDTASHPDERHADLPSWFESLDAQEVSYDIYRKRHDKHVPKLVDKMTLRKKYWARNGAKEGKVSDFKLFGRIGGSKAGMPVRQRSKATFHYFATVSIMLLIMCPLLASLKIRLMYNKKHRDRTVVEEPAEKPEKSAEKKPEEPVMMGKMKVKRKKTQ